MKRLIILIAVVTLSGCQDAQFRSREAGALGGAALGAGLGAIVGNQVGSPGAGIAIGSAFGALAGGVLGNESDKRNDQLSERDRMIQQQQRQLDENRRLIEELRRRGADAHSSERGVVVNLPDILFEFNKARLTPEAVRTAHEITEVLRSAQDRLISVEGHTDSMGTVAYNQHLSEQRARSVASELVASGVSRQRISTRGFGESAPIASNSTEDGRQRNRRVEVIIQNR